MDGIDHRHHRVEPRDVGQALAGLLAEFEGRGHRQRFGDAGAFDQQIVEATLVGEPSHLLQKVVAQRAADAAIGEFDQLLFGTAELGLLADQVRVDVDLAHVVDDHRDASSVAVVEHVIQKRRLAGSEKSGQNRDWEAIVSRLDLHLAGTVCNVITLHQAYLAPTERCQPPVGLFRTNL